MANTSRYISLSDSVLLEYEYRDQTDTTTNVYSTTVAPFLLMQDTHGATENLIFNNDNQTDTTGNTRTRMAVSTNTTTASYGYLDLNGLVALNDYDPNLTDTVSLPITFSPDVGVKYDVVRLHLVQGFNFENNEGFYFRINTRTGLDPVTGRTNVNYLNLAYRKSDSYAQINPNPFLLNGKYFASYIEVKVPSLYNMINDYIQAAATNVDTSNLPISKFTNGIGPDTRSLIETNFGWIVSNSVINGQDYFQTWQLKRVDLPTLDQYADVSAVCVGSTGGDYIELYAAWQGTIIDNFILQLNNLPGNDYIILHQLDVYEYVWSGGAAAVWTKTDNIEFVQDSNYQNPILYRPIIQFQSASAYRIDYTVRLYNREDSTSILKKTSVQFSDGLKYGKSLQKIQLGINPIQPKVYNKLFDKNVVMNAVGSTSSIESSTKYAKYLTSFLNTNQVLMTSQNAYLQRNSTTGVVEVKTVGNSATEKIFAQGLGKIQMTSADTYFKFVMYEGDPTQTISFLDLTGLGKLYLNFYTNNGSVNKFLNYMSPEISMASGEVLFKVPAKDCQRISQYNNTTFTISCVNEENETQLYTGSFITVGDAVTTYQDRKIVDQELSISEYSNQVSNLEQYNAIIVSENSQYSQLNATQNILIQDLQAALSLQVSNSNSLLESAATTEAEKAILIAELAATQTLLANVASVDGMQVDCVDANTPSQTVDPAATQANVNTSKDSPYNTNK